jgi:hypothetical protein
VRSAALVVAVAALLSSVGATTARPGSAVPAGSDPETMSGVGATETVSAVGALDGVPT